MFLRLFCRTSAQTSKQDAGDGPGAGPGASANTETPRSAALHHPPPAEAGLPEFADDGEKKKKKKKKKKKTPGEPSDSDTELRGKSLSAELPAGSELPARCSVCVCVPPWTKGLSPPLFPLYTGRGVWHSRPTTRNEAVGGSGKQGPISPAYLPFYQAVTPLFL